VRAFPDGQHPTTDMNIALTLLAAAPHEPPMIDIDGTVFLQLGVFLVLLAILHTFLFRPYLQVREARARGIDGARAEARTMEERASGIVSDYEARLTKAKQRGAEERLKLRAEGQAHERQVLAAAREAAQKEVGAAREKAKKEEDAARATLSAEVPAVAKSIATRILGRQP
jgi:F-type H+-transporting ATPase subunit b